MTTCKGCGADLPQAGGNRERLWCSERCRKAQYGGTCVDCGAATDGSNGRASAPKRCARCDQALARKSPARRLAAGGKGYRGATWIPDRKPRSDRKIHAETCRAAVARMADEIGRLPTYAEYEVWAKGRDDAPATATVKLRCGSWLAALGLREAA